MTTNCRSPYWTNSISHSYQRHCQENHQSNRCFKALCYVNQYFLQYSVTVRLFCQSLWRSLAFQQQPDAHKVPEAWVWLCLTIQLVWYQLMLGERKQFQANILCHLSLITSNRDQRLCLLHEVVYLRLFEPMSLWFLLFSAWHRHLEAPLQRHIFLFRVSSAAVPRCHTINN